MKTTLLLVLALLATFAAAQNTPTVANAGDLQKQVADTERAFARTMSDRDFAAFTRFLSAETIFFNGSKALRGKEAVADAWKRFFDKPEAPFSWRPEQVEVLDSGTLASSSGPVYDPSGRQIATFSSIWRLEAPGVWRIIFDKGNDVCDCVKSP
jgi:ketosteroid isomerase-like protein